MYQQDTDSVQKQSVQLNELLKKKTNWINSKIESHYPTIPNNIGAVSKTHLTQPTNYTV